ncbi:MAG: hypothetical protein AAFX79_05530 [Planctomycetota bacterium]
MLRRSAIRTLIGPAGIAIAVLLLAPGTAHAQFFGGGDQGPQVTRERLAQYGDLLGLDADQREILGVLHEEYIDGVQSAVDGMREAMQRARDEFEETRDRSAWEGVRELRESTTERVRVSEEQFMADMQAVLTPEQEAAWPRVERAHRRATTLPRGLMSGERVDLFAIVRDMDLSEGAASDVDAVLAEYELALDRALVQRNAAYEQGAELFRERRFDELQSFVEDARGDSERVRDTHRSFARRIEGFLAPEQADAFTAAVERASFPTVYRPTRASRAIEAAAALEGLTPDQREQVQAVADVTTRRMSEVNGRLARAIQSAEESMTLRDFIGRARGGDRGGDDATRELFVERRDIGERAIEQLRSILDETQIAAVEEAAGPEARERGGRGDRGRRGRGGDARRRF